VVVQVYVPVSADAPSGFLLSGASGAYSMERRREEGGGWDTLYCVTWRGTLRSSLYGRSRPMEMKGNVFVTLSVS
jgi:hypothetical protein